MAKSPTFSYRATVLRWLDGDTVELLLALGLNVALTEKFRLYGINTDEIHSTDPAKKAKAQQALAFCAKWAPPGTQIVVDTTKPDKYGRWLGTIHRYGVDSKTAGTTPEGTLNDALIAAKLATVYFGEGVKAEV